MTWTFAILVWWRHDMDILSAFLALQVGIPPVTGGFPSQRPVMRNFDVFFGVSRNNLLNKQSSWRWFDTSYDVIVISTWDYFYYICVLMSSWTPPYTTEETSNRRAVWFFSRSCKAQLHAVWKEASWNSIKFTQHTEFTNKALICL